VISGYDVVRRRAATLLAQGYQPKQVAQALHRELCPDSQPESSFRTAYAKLRRWRREDSSFRDLIYEMAVTELDLKAPLIFNGVSRAAMRGRVDAARLALEVTGRHTPNHETVVTNVTVQVANIPRPD
jgi:hypothetical protein